MLTRILSIDILKGIAVIGMVLVHFPWLLFLVGHPAPDDPGMGYINHVFPVLDCFVAPLFVMVTGMAVSLSVCRRRMRGVEESETLKHEIIRFILLILVGFAFNFHFSAIWAAGEVSWQGICTWSILPNLALAGLVAYFLSKTKIKYQLSAAAAIFILTPLLQIATRAYISLAPFSPELVELSESSPAVWYLIMLFVGPGVPIFPWLGFGVLGCALGSLLARKDFTKSIPYQFSFGIAFIIISQIPAMLEAAGVTVTDPIFLGIKQRYPSSLFFIFGATGINLLLSSVVFFLESKFDLSSGSLRHPANYLVICGKTSLMIYIASMGLPGRIIHSSFEFSTDFQSMLVITFLYLILQYFLSRGWIDFVKGRKFRYFELCFWLGFLTMAELALMGVGL